MKILDLTSAASCNNTQTNVASTSSKSCLMMSYAHLYVEDFFMLIFIMDNTAERLPAHYILSTIEPPYPYALANWATADLQAAEYSARLLDERFTFDKNKT